MAARKKAAVKKASAKRTPGAAKTQEAKMPSRNERRDAVFAKVAKNKGIQLMSSSDVELVWRHMRLQTGLISFDTEMMGGFPCAGISEIKGRFSVGKSYLTWQVVRQLQYLLREKMKVLFAISEMRLDITQGRKAGVVVGYSSEDVAAMERAEVARGGESFTKEQWADLTTTVGQIDEMYGRSAEYLLDGVLEAVEANVYHLIIIDSIGSLLSDSESQVDSIGEKKYGGVSVAMTKFCQHLSSLFIEKDAYGQSRTSCIIAINQIREQMNNPGLFRSVGGKALEHTKFTSVELQGGASPDKDFRRSQMTPTGMEDRRIFDRKLVYWNIDKGKAGIHEGSNGSFIFSFENGHADFYTDALVAGVNYGIIEVAGAWYTLADEDGNILLKAQGRDKFVDGLVQDAVQASNEGRSDTLMNEIRARALAKKSIDIDLSRWVDE